MEKHRRQSSRNFRGISPLASLRIALDARRRRRLAPIALDRAVDRALARRRHRLDRRRVARVHAPRLDEHHRTRHARGRTLRNFTIAVRVAKRRTSSPSPGLSTPRVARPRGVFLSSQHSSITPPSPTRGFSLLSVSVARPVMCVTLNPKSRPRSSTPELVDRASRASAVVPRSSSRDVR